MADKQKQVFVAMPFSNEMEDLYHYGIRQAVLANGFLCARIDHEIFSGGIFDQIKRKIRRRLDRRDGEFSIQIGASA